MLRGIRNNWQKSKAAVLIETAFTKSPVPFILPQGKHKFANSLVENLWSEEPSLFDGSDGARPHPIAVAAMALAYGLSEYVESRVIHGTCFAALNETLNEIDRNRNSYPLIDKDLKILAHAIDSLDFNSSFI